jgi:hypothetical protein
VIGLGTSVVLTALALFLTGGKKKEFHGPISSLGVLQTAWLLNQLPDVAQIVADVDVPTLENLRAAGMVRIELGSVRLRHVYGKKSSINGSDDRNARELGTLVDG